MSNDLPVYLIANLHVINAADYRLYEKGFFAILKRYGGEFTLLFVPTSLRGANVVKRIVVKQLQIIDRRWRKNVWSTWTQDDSSVLADPNG